MKTLPFFVASLTIAIPIDQSLADVTIEDITVHGPSLVGNLEGDSTDRQVFVYLPPGYGDDSDRRYPVVYLLHGYGGGADTWNSFHDLAGRMNAAFADGSRELIIVAPDAETLHLGSFYSNSVTIGDWETYIAGDLVEYVDSHYRTIPSRDARAIAGFSMGGYGTWRIAMKRPDVYAVAYAMSACCLAPAASSARFASLDEITTLEQARDLSMGRTSLALAAAWAPDPNNPPFYVAKPTENGEPRPEFLAAMNANAPIAMLHQYVPALLQFEAIGMEIGLQDGLLQGNERLHELLDEYGIEHRWETYEGGHGEILGERMQLRMLPFMSEHLYFGE
jgi:S-formylglutathione hydrolase FrmB